MLDIKAVSPIMIRFIRISLFVGQRFLVGGIPCANDFNAVKMPTYIGQFLSSKTNVCPSYILFDAFYSFRAWDRNYPRLLCQQPADGNTCRSRFLIA